MPRFADCPQEPLPYGSGSIQPHRVVWHRTIGKWAGDKSVLSRGKVPSVHFLVGQDEGQWVQWYDTNTKCAHAAGANDAVGIEVSGQNGEPLTDWQIRACGAIARWLIGLGIAPTFIDNGGPRLADWTGFGNHSNVLTSASLTHYDFITRDEFNRMIGGTPETPKDSNMKVVAFNVPNVGVLTYLVDGFLVKQFSSTPAGPFGVSKEGSDFAASAGLGPVVVLGKDELDKYAANAPGALKTFIAKLFPAKAARAG